MKHNMYTVFDSISGVALAPFLAGKNTVAIRLFRDALKDPISAMHKNPHDYTLFLVGVFDDETMQISETESPMAVTSGVSQIEVK